MTAPLLSTADLALMRADWNTTLPDACDIKPLVEVRTSGGLKETWPTVRETVACAFSQDVQAIGEQIIAGRYAATVVGRLRLPAETVVSAKDHVVVRVDGVALGEFGINWVSTRRSREVGVIAMLEQA